MVSGMAPLNRHRDMSIHRNSPNRRHVEGRRCPTCKRGMAMVNSEQGRFCQYCGFDPNDPLAPAGSARAPEEETPRMMQGIWPAPAEGRTVAMEDIVPDVAGSATPTEGEDG